MTDRFRPSMIESATEREEYYRLKREEKALIEKMQACKRVKYLESQCLRLKQVLMLRYWHQMTLEEIGVTMGLTRERVRQLEEQAIALVKMHPRGMELRELFFASQDAKPLHHTIFQGN